MAYVIAYLTLWNLGMLVPAERSELTRSQVALVFGLMLILVLGLRAAYQANGGPEGRDLAGRLLALGWVIGLRMTMLWLAFFIVGFVLIFAAAATKRELYKPAIEITVGAFILFANVVFFWRLAHHLKDLRRAA